MKAKLLILILTIFYLSCKKDNQNSTLPNAYSNKSVGTSANDLLSAGKFTSLKIEIHFMPNNAPDPGAISHFQNLLNSLLNKSGGIQITQKQIASGGKSNYTLADIKSIEKSNRTVFTEGNTLGVYILITDGDYIENGVLGIAYLNTSFVLLGKTIRDNSGGIGKASLTKLEATVMEHEFGHLLGLVNLGSSMQTNHEDAAHNKHCSNSNCIMYYASETTDILGFLLTGSIPAFDTNCANDLKANGGK